MLRYQDIEEPIACADGTTQREMCDREGWCGDNRATPAPGVLGLGLGLGVLLLRPRRR